MIFFFSVQNLWSTCCWRSTNELTANTCSRIRDLMLINKNGWMVNYLYLFLSLIFNVSFMFYDDVTFLLELIHIFQWSINDDRRNRDLEFFFFFQYLKKNLNSSWLMIRDGRLILMFLFFVLLLYFSFCHQFEVYSILCCCDVSRLMAFRSTTIKLEDFVLFWYLIMVFHCAVESL